MEKLKCVVAFLLIAVVSVLVRASYEKIPWNKAVKSIFLGLLYGAVSILCSFLTGHNIISYANSAVLVGGVLFGGPVGIIAGVISGVERYLAVFLYHASSITKFSLPISLIFSGLLSAAIRRLIVDKNSTKWYFGLIISAIVEVINLLLIFLLNLSDTSSAYYFVKEYGFYNIITNTNVVAIILILCCLVSKQKLFGAKRPISIQSKVQLYLGSAIIVGFVAIASISYSVLDSTSKETTKNQITMSFDDLSKNIDSDVQTQMEGYFKTFLNTLKQGRINLHTGREEPEVSYTVNEMQYNGSKCNLTEETIFRKDGSIYASTNSYIASLKNISQLKIEQFNTEETGYVTLPYQYIEQLGGNYKCTYSRFYNAEDNYFFLVCIDETQFRKFAKESIVNRGVATRHIGENGYVIVCDEENNVLASPTDNIKEKLNIDLSKKDTLIQNTVNGIEYYSYIENYEGFNFVGLLEKESCDLSMGISLYITCLTEVLVFFILYSVILLAIRFSIIRPLQRVNNSLDTICSGKLDEKVDEYSTKEMKILSNDINLTVDTLKEYMGKEAKMIQKELNFAKEIQLSALPTHFEELTKSNKEFDLYATMKTAKEVGGDFYDFFFIDKDHLCILIADVSGKGIPAAMFMMQSKMIIKGLLGLNVAIDEAFNVSNEKLIESNSAQMFVTVWCGILDLNTGVLNYINAGHNPPLVKLNGKFEYLKTKKDFVLAGLENSKYHMQTITLKPNDEIFLYTDGVTEANDIDFQLFSEARLLETVNNQKTTKSKDFCENVMKSVSEFVKEAEQSDDITMLHLKYKGKKTK